MLVLRPGAIGDTLITLPLLQYLRQQDPALRITFVGRSAVLPLISAFGLAEAVLDYEDPLWGGLFVPLSPERSNKQEKLRNLLKRMDKAIGWVADPDGLVADHFNDASITQYNIAVGRPRVEIQEHITRYLAQTIGFDWKDQDIPWSVPAGYGWQQEDIEGRPIIIHPGSGGARKCWPIENFACIITALWQKRIPVILLGGSADEERLEKLKKILPTACNDALLHIFMQAPLLTIAEQLQRSRGYLGNDTGITHLAALLHVPTLALFGPSSPIMWHPIGPTTTVIAKAGIEDIQVDAVIARLLNT